MIGSQYPEPDPHDADATAVRSFTQDTGPEAASPADRTGRRIAVEPPGWDLMPPVETETVRRYRPS
jgi:hypothetical protein